MVIDCGIAMVIAMVIASINWDIGHTYIYIYNYIYLQHPRTPITMVIYPLGYISTYN